MELVYVVTANWNGAQSAHASVGMAVPQPGTGGAVVGATLRNLMPSTTYFITCEVCACGIVVVTHARAAHCLV